MVGWRIEKKEKKSEERESEDFVFVLSEIIFEVCVSILSYFRRESDADADADANANANTNTYTNANTYTDAKARKEDVP